MGTLKFAAMARQIKLSKTIAAIRPEEEISQLKNEVKFLKSILHMKQSSTGGISQLLYTMKQLQQENDALKKATMNNNSIEAVAFQNDILKKKLKILHNVQKAGAISHPSILPYLSLKNKRDSILQRPSSSTKLYSKINNIVLEEPKPNIGLKIDRAKEIQPIKISANISFNELPIISSPNFQINKKHLKTQISQFKDTLGLSQESKSRSLRNDTSPDQTSKFFDDGLEKAHLPTLKRRNSHSDQNLRKLVRPEKILDSTSEKSGSSKVTFSQFVRDKDDNPIFKKPSSPYKLSLQSSKSNLFINSPKKKLNISGMTDVSQKTKFSAIKLKLDNIQKKLAQIDAGYGPSNSLLVTRKVNAFGVRSPNKYDRNLSSIKQQMQMFDFC
jgi:hypothetical protein